MTEGFLIRYLTATVQKGNLQNNPLIKMEKLRYKPQSSSKFTLFTDTIHRSGHIPA